MWFLVTKLLLRDLGDEALLHGFGHLRPWPRSDPRGKTGFAKRSFVLRVTKQELRDQVWI
ncbi:hypothetical protein CKO27_06670 [Thiocystis violacea]|nr:hypothetical protein [Thiocystis violacea]